jgi:hypothetical protein
MEPKRARKSGLVTDGQHHLMKGVVMRLNLAPITTHFQQRLHPQFLSQSCF